MSWLPEDDVPERRHQVSAPWLGVAAGLAVGFGLPVIEVSLACRRSISEGCVWGRALITVNIVATLVVVGIPVGLVTTWLVSRRRQTSSRQK